MGDISLDVQIARVRLEIVSMGLWAGMETAIVEMEAVLSTLLALRDSAHGGGGK